MCRVKHVLVVSHSLAGPHAPTTFEISHGPESGGRSPPQGSVAMHWNTSMQDPVAQSASVVHAFVGRHTGPLCELDGVLPGGHDIGGGPTASAEALAPARITPTIKVALEIHRAARMSEALATRPATVRALGALSFARASIMRVSVAHLVPRRPRLASEMTCLGPRARRAIPGHRPSARGCP